MPIAAGLYYSLTDDRSEKTTPPVILLHGAASSHLVWPAQMRRLRGNCTLALDLPGHGRSEGFAFQSIEDYASSVLDFLGAVNIFRAILVGHSMGGAVALTVAIHHPERVAGVGLISSGAYLGRVTDLLDLLGSTGMISSALDLFQKRAFAAATPPSLISKVMNIMRAIRPSVLINDWQASAKFDFRQQIKTLKAPLWTAVGAEDQMIPLPLSYLLLKQLPGTTLQVIPGAGHMALLEKPEEVTRGLISFLAQIGHTAAENVPFAADSQ
jgi:pimeloyl-ACP methyl ester carboxylesterase